MKNLIPEQTNKDNPTLIKKKTFKTLKCNHKKVLKLHTFRHEI